MAVQPLPQGTVLAGRFELAYELGSGPFTVAYVAHDRARGDRCVVKELAPEGVHRDEAGVVDLTASGKTAQHLRQRFADEAKSIGRLNLPCLLPVRATFSELGTSYYATDFLEGVQSLERRVLAEGPVSVAEGRRILGHLLDTLEVLHGRGILHHNLRPSNVLLAPGGRVFLVDFSEARTWYSDATVAHHVYFDPHYAAPEQGTDRLRRGPATDLFGLCATLFYALSGIAPPGPEAPMNMEDASRALNLAGVPQDLAGALAAGLAADYHDRPRSAEELRDLATTLPGEAEEPFRRLQEFDEIAGRLSRFRYEARQCPACKDVLTPPQLLRRGVCPVCHDGAIAARLIGDKFCPVCSTGLLREQQNVAPLAVCPACSLGWLSIKRKRTFSRDRLATCSHCEARFSIVGNQATRERTEADEEQEPETHTWDEWRELSGRPATFLACDSCRAQFDRVNDGRLRQVWPQPTGYRVLYPDEWAKVGAGLDLGSGNCECTSCRADFQVDGESVTLLHYFRDPFGFATRHVGHLLSWEDLRWKGAGKESLHPGLVCEHCPCEFDEAGPASSPGSKPGPPLRLVRSDHPYLARLVGRVHLMEDWHLLADGLPTLDRMAAFEEDFDESVIWAYEEGEVSFEQREDGAVLWRGPAVRLAERGEDLEEAGNGQLLITEHEVTFGGMLRKWRANMSAVRSAEAERDILTLEIEGEKDPVIFEVNPMELTAHLESGPRTVRVSAPTLAHRIAKALVDPAVPV